jgi:hypothetical protein
MNLDKCMSRFIVMCHIGTRLVFYGMEGVCASQVVTQSLAPRPAEAEPGISRQDGGKTMYSLGPLIQGILTFCFHCLTIRLIQKILQLLFILFVTNFIIQSTLSTTFRFLYLHKFFEYDERSKSVSKNSKSLVLWDGGSI